MRFWKKGAEKGEAAEILRAEQLATQEHKKVDGRLRRMIFAIRKKYRGIITKQQVVESKERTSRT